MSYRKAWTKKEDQVLKQLYEVRRIKKWVEIAKIMETQFDLKGKNGKQCRQRYHNHLDQSIKHQKWSEEEEKQLIALQSQLGNKWAEISRVIHGRSQNDIKNQFFSILRRGLRTINNIIRRSLKRNNQLEISLIYKIVQVCQKINKQKTINKQYLKNLSLKRTITKYALIDPQSIINKQKIQEIKQFITRIKLFNSKSKNSAKSQEVIDSQQIQSAELRDKFPSQRKLVSKRSNQSMKPSIQNKKQISIISQLQQQQIIQDNINQDSLPYLRNLKRKSSLLSNPSFQINANRFFQMAQQEPLFKLNESGQYDYITTPTPRPMISPSPYFDQVKSNFNNWNSFFSH